MSDYPIISINRDRAIIEAQSRREIVMLLRSNKILNEGVDYGIVPGTIKPTLLKPGAERLCAALGLDPRFELQNCIENFDAAAPMFHYRYMCRLIHIESGAELATGIGSCNSMEDKYRWRWMDRVPAGYSADELTARNSTLFEFEFAINKAETSGKYGKSSAYWQRFKDAIADGSARKTQKQTARGMSDGYEIGGVQYRVPNDEIFSLVNTIDKMAQKRALIAAVLIGANASEFFTQDVEDLPGFGGLVIDAEFTEVKHDEPPAPVPATNVKKMPIPFKDIKPAGELPAASGTPWTDAQWKAWAAKNVRDDFPAEMVFKALGITRPGEWTGDADSASKRLTAWMDAQAQHN